MSTSFTVSASSSAAEGSSLFASVSSAFASFFPTVHADDEVSGRRLQMRAALPPGPHTTAAWRRCSCIACLVCHSTDRATRSQKDDEESKEGDDSEGGEEEGGDEVRANAMHRRGLSADRCALLALL